MTCGWVLAGWLATVIRSHEPSSWVNTSPVSIEAERYTAVGLMLLVMPLQDGHGVVVQGHDAEAAVRLRLGRLDLPAIRTSWPVNVSERLSRLVSDHGCPPTAATATAFSTGAPARG
jgi:hypothetical protein